MKPTADTRANKTDAGNGSKAICRVSNVLRSPSPDPRRSSQSKQEQNLQGVSNERRSTEQKINTIIGHLASDVGSAHKLHSLPRN